MAKLKLEYLWLDGYTPVANLRGKTKIVEADPSTFSLEDCPMWGFDGSSPQVLARTADPEASTKNDKINLPQVAGIHFALRMSSLRLHFCSAPEDQFKINQQTSKAYG